jgi:hypothetical protein
LCMRQPPKPELRSFAYRLLIYFVVVWMAVFYPAVCQYHGLLLFGSPTMQRQHNMDTATDATTARYKHVLPHHTAEARIVSGSLTPDANNPHEASMPRLRHTTFPLNTTPMSLYVLALPLEVSFKLRQLYTSQIVMLPSLAHQHQLSPPDQPPRLSPA